MALLGLGYAGFGSDALDDWRQFGTSLVGLQAVERGNSLLAFRMDDRKQRIVIDRALPEGTRFFGWEMAAPADLDALEGVIEIQRADSHGRHVELEKDMRGPRRRRRLDDRPQTLLIRRGRREQRRELG